MLSFLTVSDAIVISILINLFFKLNNDNCIFNYMVKKIANITLVHECDEKNCHLDNPEQTKWIENILPKEKLEFIIFPLTIGG